MAAASAMAGTSSETTSEEQVITQEPKEANSTTAQKKSKQRKRGRRGPRWCRGDSFATYFRLVLKQVHQGLSLSRETVSVMDSMVHDILDRIATEAGRLARSAKRVTITAWDIQIAGACCCRGRWAGSSSPTARRPFSERQYMPYSNRKSEYADRRTKTVRNML
ncbi:Histone H2B type W-T [Plecturocebus cupreus]